VLSSAADDIGRRRALALSVLLLFIGSILTALSWNLESLAIFRAVTGLGMGAEISLAATIMTELSPPRIRGRGVALNVFWGGVGLAAHPGSASGSSAGCRTPSAGGSSSASAPWRSSCSCS
jgi:putative MFS transporter